MADVHSFAELARVQLQRGYRVERAVTAEFDAGADRLVRLAVRLTSGPKHTAAGLRAQGHPYARRAPRAAPLPVGQMSGALARRWVKQKSGGAGRQVITVRNTAADGSQFALMPYGTRNTIARGVFAELNEEAARLSRRIAAAKSREESR